MKNCSPPGSNDLLSSYTLQDNCDCLCHFQEECKMNPQDRNILQNISPLHYIVYHLIIPVPLYQIEFKLVLISLVLRI